MNMKVIKQAVEHLRNEELLTKGLVARCADHPTYRGIRRPRVECKPCEALYASNQPKKKKEPCSKCKGRGYTSYHDRYADGHGGLNGGSWVSYNCDQCGGTGR